MGAAPGRDVTRRFSKVLVANRGEIAVRVLRTLKALGIPSVAVYSDADKEARHVREADEAVRIGPPAPGASYLSIAPVIDAAKKTNAAAVHPGYGFLSERADFARACEEAGIVFVGPPAAVLEATGDKLGVKAQVAKAGVPVIPGPLGEVGEGDAQLAAAAKAAGFPMLLKAVGGGGGRGMRQVDRAEDLADAAGAARREAGGAFGDTRLYAEALVHPARHVEVQILCDDAGNVRVLGERDCSMQRRHQKVIEETPAPGLDRKTRDALHAAAVRAAKALGYRNAGTVEFLLDTKGQAHFLEVNRRLQVEHPITEAVHGLDLVEWQLRVAAGETLPADLGATARGHAVEARVCAEDPDRGFVPSSGRILRLREPSGEGIRVDSGFSSGSDVPPYYDSLLMKVTAHGKDRIEALSRLDAALAQTAVIGVATNVAFLRRLASHKDFRAANLRIDFLDVHAQELVGDGSVPLAAILAAAAADLLGVDAVADPIAGRDTGARRGRRRETAWASLTGWRFTSSEVRT